MPDEMISYFLCDVNSLVEDYASAKIWKSVYTLKKCFYWIPNYLSVTVL